MKKSWVYNIECYPNYFTIGFLDTHRNEQLIKGYIQADINGQESAKAKFKNILIEQDQYREFTIDIENDIDEASALCLFVQENIYYLVGFNNKNYDNPLLNFVLFYYPRLRIATLNKDIYKVSSKIISLQDEWSDDQVTHLKLAGTPYIAVDMMPIALTKIERKSLNQAMINLKWYKIIDQPVVPGKELNQEEKEIIKEHNFDNILKANALFVHLKELVDLRIGINFAYGLTIKENVLVRDKPGIADIILAKFYGELTNQDYTDFNELRTYRKKVHLADCIVPVINFKTPELNALLDKIKSKSIVETKKEINFSVTLGDTEYAIKSGGLHSTDTPLCITNKDTRIIDKDVKGYYPRLIYEHRIKPAHLEDAWYDCVIRFIEEKESAKAAGDKVKEDTMKIVNNSGVFGKMGNVYSWLLDKKALVTVTISGQLLILMCIEDLYLAGFKVISANTDGFTTLVPEDRVEEFEAICSAWEKKTRLELETSEYEKYVRRDVNNYCVKYAGKDKYKEKGSFFIREILVNKGYFMPIVPIALHNYYFKNIPIDVTITNHKGAEHIYDYCDTQKIGKDFRVIFQTFQDGIPTKELIQRTIRYYVTTDSLTKENVGFIFKEYTDDAKAIKITEDKATGKKVGKRKKPMAVNARQKVKMLNKFHPVQDFEDYKVNYNYYIKVCNQIINIINHPLDSSHRKRKELIIPQQQLNLF